MNKTVDYVVPKAGDLDGAIAPWLRLVFGFRVLWSLSLVLCLADYAVAQERLSAIKSETLADQSGITQHETTELSVHNPPGAETEPDAASHHVDKTTHSDDEHRELSALAWWWANTTAVPIVLYGPETGLMLGVGGITTFDLTGQENGRPSNASLLGIYTTRGQTIVLLSHELRGPSDRHVFSQFLRYIDWPDRFFGIGNEVDKGISIIDPDEPGGERDYIEYTDRYVQLESEYLHRVRGSVYLGLRHQIRHSQTLDVEVAAEDVGFYDNLGVGDVFWSGLGPVLLWDDRIGLIWPTGGNLIRLDATFFGGFFGSAFDAQLYRVDLRHYRTLWSDHVLAGRYALFGAGGDAPFQLLPSLGGPDLLRGWYLGRLRDRVMSCIDLEYRVPLSTHFSTVAFASTGRVASGLDQLAARQLRTGGGLGLRYALDTVQRANLRLDLAYGQSFEVYFQFKEAF